MPVDRASMLVPAIAGAALGGAFRAAAKLRGGRPLHPEGVVYDAVITRHGIRPSTGADWLDRKGTDRGLARLSRAAGLPEWMPDVHGMAVIFTDADGERCDLLLATTGRSAPARFALIPRRDPWTATYGSLFPYYAGGRLALVAAAPVHGGGPGGTHTFALAAARLFGPWRRFGVLELTERSDTPSDEPVRFDPRHAPPGLRCPRALMELREPAYAAARTVPDQTRVSAGPARVVQGERRPE